MRIRTELLLLKRFAIFFGVWLALAGVDVGGLAFGLAAAVAATLVSVRFAPPGERSLRLLRLLALVPGFLWRSVAGASDVARRAFDPKLPINPGWVSYPVRLPPGAPRVLLGGEISLLPGTLVAGTRDNCLIVHCLERGMPVATQIAQEEDKVLGAMDDG